MTLARLAMPALRAAADGTFAHEAACIADALELGVGGFIVFGGTRETVSSLTADLVRRAGRPLLLGSDLERGAGQQFAGLTEFPPPAALASLDDLAAVATAGRVTGAEARSVGINWVFAPVADLDLEPDNPIVQSRAFGSDPAAVAARVGAWVTACQEAGALACAKHYPGHGRTRTDSHAGLPVVDAGADELEADAAPFDAALAAGVASVMTAHVAYPALDGSGAPATRSRPILDRLRVGRKFGGLVVTDALIMDGATAGTSEAEGVVGAIAAGVDILLYPNDLRGVVQALDAAEREGRIEPVRVADALERYRRALARAGGAAAASGDGPATAFAIADRLLSAGRRRENPPALRLPLTLAVIDDDLGGPYPPGPSDWAERALGSAAAPGGSGSRVALVFSEPRGWKGRAGLGAAALASLEALGPVDLFVLFGHPRLMAELPAGTPVLVAWHRQRLMQDAVARWLRRAGAGVTR